MTDIQAVLGISQLRRYPTFLEIRKNIAGMYYNEIPKELTQKMQHIRNKSMYFRFLLNTNQVLKFSKIKRLYQNKNIVVRRGVDELLHRTYKKGINFDFPNANNCFDTTLSIPIYPSLSERNVKKIIKVTNDLHEKGILI
jgi:UDP-4-amino-4-deoxy-L-arabinose-oxoglutarate aminotransferase